MSKHILFLFLISTFSFNKIYFCYGAGLRGRVHSVQGRGRRRAVVLCLTNELFLLCAAIWHLQDEFLLAQVLSLMFVVSTLMLFLLLFSLCFAGKEVIMRRQCGVRCRARCWKRLYALLTARTYSKNSYYKSSTVFSRTSSCVPSTFPSSRTSIISPPPSSSATETSATWTTTDLASKTVKKAKERARQGQAR